MEDEVLPVSAGYWERAEVPLDLCRRPGELGLVCDGIEGYGCPPMSPTAAGLILMELSRGDGSLSPFSAVQAGLAMRSIAMFGFEERKQRWLPPMARRARPGTTPASSRGRARCAIWQAEIHLDDMRVPAENRLPGANRFNDTGRVLASTRQSCAWMALGHAVAAYDTALTDARQRHQFGKPLVSFQIIQDSWSRGWPR